LGGLAGADGLCATRAMAASLPGTYRAWLSTSTVNAKDRLAGARGWVRTDGLPFADTIADIVSGKILYPIRLDERGADLPTALGQVFVATGTDPDGTLSTTQVGTCDDFTTVNGSVAVGDAAGGTAAWTSAYLASGCGAAMHI